ncbi:hypothetical protein NHX12_022280 [Muraenolepis orangiensis]|uniref:FZ domain-containing protein n=1 Tax=Muraenolepis orangiensis TaxID=630683 RepID=A0A9Q0EQQ7_9TELE|nr:hypothetical protein NHX12_022280 [Muraenolepis orangiensis]
MSTGRQPGSSGDLLLRFLLHLLWLLPLLSGLPGPGEAAEEYDYYSWQSDNFHNGRFYTKQPQCVDIPADLRLCHAVGYEKMRLPNLLEHETMPEVRQQAGSWVPLLAKRCHADTQVFLCSLFAPVCLDRPIYPCRSLCEAVRDGCAPVMETYGFPWPAMLTCSKGTASRGRGTASRGRGRPPEAEGRPPRQRDGLQRQRTASS